MAVLTSSAFTPPLQGVISVAVLGKCTCSHRQLRIGAVFKHTSEIVLFIVIVNILVWCSEGSE